MEIVYIIPTLNEEAHLSGTLDSVIVQTGEREIIVVDGGAEMSLSKSLDLMAVRRSLTRPEEDSDEIERVLSRPGTLAGTFRSRISAELTAASLIRLFLGSISLYSPSAIKGSSYSDRRFKPLGALKSARFLKTSKSSNVFGPADNSGSPITLAKFYSYIR